MMVESSFSTIVVIKMKYPSINSRKSAARNSGSFSLYIGGVRFLLNGVRFRESGVRLYQNSYRGPYFLNWIDTITVSPFLFDFINVFLFSAFNHNQLESSKIHSQQDEIGVDGEHYCTKQDKRQISSKVFMDGGVVGSDGCWTGMLVDDYPRGAKSIGSSPSSSRVGRAICN